MSNKKLLNNPTRICMNWIKSLFVFFAALLIAIFLSEYIVRTVTPQNLSGSWRIVDSTGLWMNKSTGSSIHSFNDIKVKYTFSEYGVRDYPPIDLNRKGKTLVLGDSFTFGWLLNDTDNYIFKLSERSQTSIFNAAAGGWGLADYLRYIDNYCLKIKPRNVLIVLTGTEIGGRLTKSPLYSYDMDRGLLVTKVPKKTWKIIIKEFVNHLPFYQFLMEKSHFLQLVRKVLLVNSADKVNEKNFDSFNKLKSDDQTNKKDIFIASYYKAVFSKIVDKIYGCGATPIFTHLGLVETSSDVTNMGNAIAELKKHNFFKKHNVSLFDLTETEEMQKYRANKTAFSIPLDGHPSIQGASLIYQAMVSAGIKL